MSNFFILKSNLNRKLKQSTQILRIYFWSVTLGLRAFLSLRIKFVFFAFKAFNFKPPGWKCNQVTLFVKGLNCVACVKSVTFRIRYVKLLYRLCKYMCIFFFFYHHLSELCILDALCLRANSLHLVTYMCMIECRYIDYVPLCFCLRNQIYKNIVKLVSYIKSNMQSKHAKVIRTHFLN